MSLNQKVDSLTEDGPAASLLQTAAYIAELLQEMEGLARRDGITALEGYLRDARLAAQKLAGRG